MSTAIDRAIQIVRERNLRRRKEMGEKAFSKEEARQRKSERDFVKRWENGDYGSDDESDEETKHKTKLKTRKYHIPEPHAQKVKEIDDYMKQFEYDMIKLRHKQYNDYLNSLKHLESMKGNIKSLKKNKYEKIEKPKPKTNEFNEVINLLEKALEKGSYTKEIQNAIKYIKKFK
jgi:hypothetical protein